MGMLRQAVVNQTGIVRVRFPAAIKLNTSS